MTNEIMKRDQINSMIATESGASFCSIDLETADRATQAKIYNAINNPENKIADYINRKIKVRDVLIEVMDIANEETGELSQAPRVVLIDDEGRAYQSVSIGMFQAVKAACKVFGAPSWEPPLEVLIKQKAVGKGSMLTFDVVG